jgi:hypothetical protein
MPRPIPDKNPFKMRQPVRRDLLSGEATMWYDRAEWLQGRALNVPPDQRTAFQQRLDEIWECVDRMESGDESYLDRVRLDRIYHSFFKRWPEVFGPQPPADSD